MKSVNDQIFWKLLMAVIWSLVLEAMLLILLVCADINFFSPVTWLDALCTAVSLRLWICFLPLAAITAVQVIMCGRKCLMSPGFSRTRFEIVRNLISRHNLVMALVYPLMSFLIVWTFLSAVGKEHLKVNGSCKNPHHCVNEGYVFLAVGGVWSGIHFFLTNYIWDCGSLIFPIQFPVVQQLKFIQIKSELWSMLKQAMYRALWPILYFLVVFYMKSETLYGLLSLSVEKNGLSFLVIFHAWIFNTCFLFTTLATKHLLQVYLTEHWEFPVAPKSDTSIRLHEAMSMKHHPVIQTLACYDLWVIAERDFCRRQEIFALSQPGGHPHNWNVLIKEILMLIDNFTSELETAVFEVGISPNLLRSIVGNVPVVPAQHMHLKSIRNLSVKEPVQQLSTTQTPLSDYVSDVVKKRVTLFVDSLMKKPGIHFMFGDIPDSKVQFVLTQSLPVIWTSQGASCLFSKALKEDKYGVVLKDLSVVIVSLINLKLVLDKIHKLGNYKRSSRNEQDALKIKIALRSAVKRSLYRICLTYGESVMEVDMPTNIKSQLQLFLSMKEG